MRIQHYSMAGAVALVGCSIFALAGAVVFSTLGNSAQAGVGSAAPAVAAAAVAQGGGEPTIVWYQATSPRFFRDGRNDPYNGYELQNVYRAWSNGVVEFRTIKRKVESWTFDPNGAWVIATHYCESVGQCVSPWTVCSSQQEGLASFADLNADANVDGVDLAQVLSNWGPAPRNESPPSDCPLNLVNP